MKYDDLIIILKEEEQRRRKALHVITWISVAILGICAASFGLAVGRGKDVSEFPMMLLGVVPLIGVGVGFSSRAKSALADAIDSNDPLVVANLFEALGSGDPELVKVAAVALTQILPTLEPGSVTLDLVQYRHFVNFLSFSEDQFAEVVIRSSPVFARPELPQLLSQIESGTFRRTKGTSELLKGAARLAIPDVRLQLAREIVSKAVAEADLLRLNLSGRLKTGYPDLQEHSAINDSSSS